MITLSKNRHKGRIVRIRPNGCYNWRDVWNHGVRQPRAWQARADGPPLLFATDMRMSILVTLALAGGMMRRYHLVQYSGGGTYNSALDKLVDDGLVAALTITRKKVLYGLDPAHPAAIPIRSLLLKIAESYSFKTPTCDPGELEGGESPSRRSRKRDARYTFGDPVRTLVLLAVYILGTAHMSKVTQVLGRFSATSIRNTLWRFRAFGVLNAAGSPRGRKGIAFSLNADYCFASEIREVLASLAVALPHWNVAIVKAATSGRPVIRDKRRKGLNQKDAALKRWTRS
jgi:hypothetical protein